MFTPPDWFMCLASLNHVILVMSGSVNFLIYCTYGKKFKSMLQKVLKRSDKGVVNNICESPMIGNIFSRFVWGRLCLYLIKIKKENVFRIVCSKHCLTLTEDKCNKWPKSYPKMMQKWCKNDAKTMQKQTCFNDCFQIIFSFFQYKDIATFNKSKLYHNLLFWILRSFINITIR